MAAKSSDYRMAIKIAGEIEKSLYTSTDLTRKELNKIAREAAYTSAQTKESFSKGLKETEPFFNGLENTGIKAFKAVSVAAVAAGTTIIGIGAASAKAGMEFESAFAGVKKTTDATSSEYEQMKTEILAMTREIPAAGTEIAGVTEAAGQLGIEKEKLLEFSRTMIDLGESTNLSSTEAASSLAKFANITNMSADDYGRLGSTIVDLGNNFATTEADIVAMATKLASSGELAGFSEAQIMAMSTAMSSVGIEAEAGGSSMSKMIKTVQVAVETGNKSLKDYAKVAGMSAEEFKDAFEKDGLSAVSAFIGGLNDTERNGKSATVILDEMGLTEIRLSNTLLSLANADDLMSEAVETANTAWEENTALTKEAAQRYETTESKLAIMKNGFTEMGIEMSDQFNGPLREGIDIVTELVHKATAEIAGSNVIHDIAQDIVDGVPTAIRITKTLAETVGDFAEPFLTVGGWLADNPKLLESTVAGLGTALITYKTVKGIRSLATAFTSLGAASLPVLGLTGAAAVIGGVTVAVKKSAEEARKANLDKHFGNISLSMRDLEEAAAFIVSNDSMGELQESIKGLRELEGIGDSIDDAVSELNRMNWKVSLGMQLKEDEQELYKQSIANYVADVQSYIEQEQYSVNLAVGVLTGEDLENSNIVKQLNEFYSGKSAELAELGTDLNNTVTEAFTDNLLTIPEAETISGLQQQIANIKASLAVGTYEANLDLIGLKYGAGELDADSFMNMQEEINEQNINAKQYYDEAYTAYNAAQRSMLADEKITQEQYDNNMTEADRGYLEQVGGLETKAMNFQTDTIYENYSEVFGGIENEKLQNQFGQILNNSFTEIENGMPAITAWSPDQILYEMGMDDLDHNTVNSITKLWNSGMSEQFQKMEETRADYLNSGMEVPEELEESMRKTALIGMIANDNKAAWSGLGMEIDGQEEYNEKIKKLTESGAEIPEAFTNSMIENSKQIIEEGAKNIRDTTEQELNGAFADGIDINTDLNFDFNYRSEKGLPLFMKPKPSFAKGIDNNADGGIITKPTISWLAEGGYSESVIPLDGSPNAISLWQQTGELLGIPKRDSFSSIMNGLITSGGSSTYSAVNNSEESSKFVFNPSISIGKGADEENIKDVMRDMFGEFKEYITQVMEDRENDIRRYSLH